MGVVAASMPQPGAWAFPQFYPAAGDAGGGASDDQRTAASLLDGLDLAVMLYALRFDVPGFAAVFSDYPASTTAFMNCVPRFEASLPVSAAQGWTSPGAPVSAVRRAAGGDAEPPWAMGEFVNTTVALDATHLWRMGVAEMSSHLRS